MFDSETQQHRLPAILGCRETALYVLAMYVLVRPPCLETWEVCFPVSVTDNFVLNQSVIFYVSSQETNGINW